MIYTDISNPKLKAWFGPFDSSIVSFLESETKKLIVNLCDKFYSAIPVFADPVVDDQLQVDGYPKYITHEFPANVNEKEIAKTRVEFVYWNPRDGESWAFSVYFYPPARKAPIFIQVKDNFSDPHFEVGYYEGEENSFEEVKGILEDFNA